LGLDTSLSACSAAVHDTSSGKLLAHRLEEMTTGHAERLPAMVREVIDAAGIGFPKLNRIGVTIGPGTFTGVRIGLAFARGLGLALGKLVVGISTLKALAANVKVNSMQLPIAVAIDARRDTLYLQIFAADLTPLDEPEAIAVDHAMAALPASPVMLCGSGASLLAARSPELQSDLLHLSASQSFPDAGVVARLAAELPVGGPPRPLYLRSQAGSPEEPPGAGPGNFEIETVGSLHAGIFSVLHAECFDAGWDEAAFASLMALPGTRSYLAYSGAQEPVAFALIRQAADEAEVLTIGTRPKKRRRGIATALLAHVSERLRTSGVRNLFIEVAASNSGARAFYARAGFRVGGTRHAYYANASGSREDALIMIRRLK
jgi:tRNA threonylcarbamoyl adenosine modification protein YeaZ/ribosomal-protein-alanine acetyltransferase